ncbi:MAG: hypothetical protein LBS51_01045 [Oscillospiraceae bacterium]|nr:hypothetical protein [Oscillospiraceae bacterium]
MSENFFQKNPTRLDRVMAFLGVSARQLSAQSYITNFIISRWPMRCCRRMVSTNAGAKNKEVIGVMIFCFTSTGNSLAVAKQIGGNLISIPQVIGDTACYFFISQSKTLYCRMPS